MYNYSGGVRNSERLHGSLWNMSFTLWLCDIALSLALREKEKITAKLKEKDDE